MTLLFDMYLNHGETTSIIFPVVDKDNQPVTVDGWTGRAQVRESETAPLLYEWTGSANNITVAGTSVTLSIPAADSTAWRWTQGLYDLRSPTPEIRCTALPKAGSASIPRLRTKE
jgi:hypothetical protein